MSRDYAWKMLVIKANALSYLFYHFNFDISFPLPLPFSLPSLLPALRPALRPALPSSLVVQVDTFVTPNALFFKRNHLPVPDVKEEDYLLEVKRREEGRDGGRKGGGEGGRKEGREGGREGGKEGRTGGRGGGRGRERKRRKAGTAWVEWSETGT